MKMTFHACQVRKGKKIYIEVRRLIFYYQSRHFSHHPESARCNLYMLNQELKLFDAVAALID